MDYENMLENQFLNFTASITNTTECKLLNRSNSLPLTNNAHKQLKSIRSTSLENIRNIAKLRRRNAVLKDSIKVNKLRYLKLHAMYTFKAAQQ